MCLSIYLQILKTPSLILPLNSPFFPELGHIPELTSQGARCRDLREEPQLVGLTDLDPHVPLLAAVLARPAPFCRELVHLCHPRSQTPRCQRVAGVPAPDAREGPLHCRHSVPKPALGGLSALGCHSSGAGQVLTCSRVCRAVPALAEALLSEGSL